MPGDQPTNPKISIEKIKKPVERVIKKTMDTVGITVPTKKEIKNDIIKWSIISSIAVVLVLKLVVKK